MKPIAVGDQVWCSFVVVDFVGPRSWVYPLTVLMVTDDGELICHDARLSKSRSVVRDSGESVSRSEAEAWRVCEVALQRIAGQCLDMASQCASKAKGVRYVVA
jgi:hypothetical protein